MPTAKISGEERTYCADCYWKLEKEYKGKRNCEECSYFSEEQCKRLGKRLEAVTVGYNTYFVEAEGCGDFSTDKDVALDEVKKLMAQGQFEEAAAGYERLGMYDEAEAARRRMPAPSANAADAVKALAKRGQTLTYYCPHCGAPLKVGAKATQIQRTCPSCGGDLEVVKLGELIKQHLS
jgi:rRNA maturation protein Nop10